MDFSRPTWGLSLKSNKELISKAHSFKFFNILKLDYMDEVTNIKRLQTEVGRVLAAVY